VKALKNRRAKRTPIKTPSKKEKLIEVNDRSDEKLPVSSTKKTPTKSKVKLSPSTRRTSRNKQSDDSKQDDKMEEDEIKTEGSDMDENTAENKSNTTTSTPEIVAIEGTSKRGRKPKAKTKPKAKAKPKQEKSSSSSTSIATPIIKNIPQIYDIFNTGNLESIPESDFYKDDLNPIWRHFTFDSVSMKADCTVAIKEGNTVLDSGQLVWVTARGTDKFTEDLNYFEIRVDLKSFYFCFVGVCSEKYDVASNALLTGPLTASIYFDRVSHTIGYLRRVVDVGILVNTRQKEIKLFIEKKEIASEKIPDNWNEAVYPIFSCAVGTTVQLLQPGKPQIPEQATVNPANRSNAE